MKTTANLTVYVQALGGKFLGPNAWKPEDIKVIFKTANREYDLPYYHDGLNDGDVNKGYQFGNSSFLPIITQDQLHAVVPPVVNYLTPNSQTVVAKGVIDLQKGLEGANLTVMLPTPTGKVFIQQTVVLTDEQDEYKLTVIVPGLLIKQATVNGNLVQATVTMMCGCPVKSAFYWLPTDFEVKAFVEYMNGSSAVFPLYFDVQINDSVFGGSIQNYQDIARVVFTANQKSTGNFGFWEYIHS